MTELHVEIVQLEPMRVASALGFGESPEFAAIETLLAWARPQGLLEEGYTAYGFNNPDPSPGSPNYGYEIWLPVGGEVQGGESVEIKDYPGGLFGVARCEGTGAIGDAWKALVAWREGSSYGQGHHQWLEKFLVPPDAPVIELRFDLYLPIVE